MSLKKVSTEEKGKAVIEFAVDAATFENAVNAVYNRKKANITLPGFRKGKAPKSLIEKMYGKGFLYEDAVNDLLPAAFEEAVSESKLEIVGSPSFEIVSIDDNGLVMSAAVELKPEIEIKDYKGISLTKRTVEVTDAEVDEEIERTRQRNFKDGVAFVGGKSEGHQHKLGSGQVITGFEEQIVGHSVGDEFEINVTFPAEYHAPELAGAPVVFKIKLNGLKEVILPELDDEFAKDVSDFDTLDEYKADVKATIEKRKTEQADRLTDDEIVDVLVSKVEGDIPECMYDTEVDDMVSQYDNRLKSQGLDLATYLKYTNSDISKLKTELRPDAIKRVKSRLALEKIAALEAIEASEQDVADEIKKIADAYKMEVSQVESLVSKEGIAKDVKVSKAATFVKDNAVFEEK